MRTETVAEQLFFTTVFLQARSASSSTVGTGFIVDVATVQGSLHMLVTNKHVLAGADSLDVRLIRDVDGTPSLGHAVETRIRPFSTEMWLSHPEPDVDIAILPVAPIFNDMASRGDPPFFRSVSTSLFASVETLAELDALEQVTFIGYPNGLYDSANFLPIARRGMTATPLQVDYRGKPSFLIDASVFPGSSGSPVFLLDRGMVTDRSGNVSIASRVYCLGIVAAVHVRSAAGEIIRHAGDFGVSFQEPIDLGIVFRASAIEECIALLLARIGLHPVPVDESGPPGELSHADELLEERLVQE